MTTTDAPKAPGLFSKAEAGSRQIVLQVGLGFGAFIIGSIFSAGASTRILDRIGVLESENLEWFLRTILERTWLFLFVPAIGWGIGRFTELKAARFAMLAGFSGETVSLLLITGMNGIDFVVQDARGVIVRLLGLFTGMALTVVTVNAGRRAAALAQARGLAEAAKRKDEYAAFLAAAEAPKPGEEPPKS